MKKTNKLLITAIVASSILGTAYASAHRIYDDVPTNHWAYEAVRVLSEKGLLQGLPNGSFKGDKPLTRYSFAVVVSRMLDRYNELISNNNQVNEKDIKALENLVTEFINEIESLSEEVKELKSDVKTVQSSLTDAKSNISQLNTKTTDLENRLDNLGKVKVTGDILAQTINYSKTAKEVDAFNNLQVRIGFNAKPSDKVEADFRYVAYDRDLNSNSDSLGKALSHNDLDRQRHDYNGFSKSQFGRARGSNEVEIANIKVKDVFKEGDQIKVGRDFETHGHALVLNDYADSITYSTKSGDVKIEAGAIFSDYNNGIYNKKDKQIWKFSADTDVKGHNIYAGIYTQRGLYVYNKDANNNPSNLTNIDGVNTKQNKSFKDINKFITELGSKGNLTKDGKLRYDVAMVASSNERTNMYNRGRKDKATGYMEHVGIAWDSDPNLTVKASYTTADEKFDGILSLDKNQSSIDGTTTPFDDIARFQNLLSGMLTDKFYNTSDFKFELIHKFANKQSVRFAYDLVKNNKDNVNTGFTELGQNQANWNMTNNYSSGTEGFNKLDAKISTLEYKYQFDPSSRLSIGLTNADLGDCKDYNNNRVKDERVFWTELFSKF